MIPLRDPSTTRVKPVITVLLILVNLGVFFLIQSRGTAADQQALIYERAAIACEVTKGSPLNIEEIVTERCPLPDSPSEVPFPDKNVLLAILVSMFLHGGVTHVLFNMWFLWIFGNNVEEAFGHLGYLSLYLLGGLAGTVAYVFGNPDSTIPLVGASGAIAVTMGAYTVLFPGNRIISLVGWFILPVPAVVFLVLWFLTQFGLGGTSVAWEAHVGGFVFGALVSLLFRQRLLRRTAAVYR
ncbi:MAG: rhomboid family intramembrane serine protease [Acidimicrobiia bacterium]